MSVYNHRHWSGIGEAEIPDSLETAISAAIDEIESVEGKRERFDHEENVIESFATEHADTLAEGKSNNRIDYVARDFSDVTEFYTQTEARSDIERTVERKADSAIWGTPFDQLLLDSLEQLTANRNINERGVSTHQSYTFTFDDGTTITRCGSKQLRDHVALREKYYEESGVYTAPPLVKRRDDRKWEDFIWGLRAEHAKNGGDDA